MDTSHSNCNAKIERLFFNFFKFFSVQRMHLITDSSNCMALELLLKALTCESGLNGCFQKVGGGTSIHLPGF